MSRYYFNVEAMNLDKHKSLIAHVYRSSVESLGRPILEGHPLSMICHAMCQRYNIEAAVEVQKNSGFVALDLKDCPIEESLKIRHKLKFMAETLLLAEVTEVY